jgi:PAS domain S-box-containing protein
MKRLEYILDAIDTVSLFEENPIPMWIIEEEGLQIISVNKAAVKIYGYSADEFTGMRIVDLYPPSDKKLFELIHDAKKMDSSDRSIWRHIKADNSLIHVDFRYQPLQKKDSEQLWLMMALPVNQKADMLEIEKYRHMGIYKFLKKREATQAEFLWLKKVYDFVLHRLDKSISNGDLGVHMSQSSRTLNRTCNDITGISPSQLIQEIKFGRVRLCQEAGLVKNATEMAKMAGFTDQYYFTKKYKEVFGKSFLD